ncbi:MAG: hypothetical protein INR70_02205 [Parafilimonas terrae]|nr:hypothetical protein [Parafilimonas terrae]
MHAALWVLHAGAHALAEAPLPAPALAPEPVSPPEPVVVIAPEPAPSPPVRKPESARTAPRKPSRSKGRR